MTLEKQTLVKKASPECTTTVREKAENAFFSLHWAYLYSIYAEFIVDYFHCFSFVHYDGPKKKILQLKRAIFFKTLMGK